MHARSTPSAKAHGSPYQRERAVHLETPAMDRQPERPHRIPTIGDKEEKKWFGADLKPGSVSPRGVTAISLGGRLLGPSSDLPGSRYGPGRPAGSTRRNARATNCSLLNLAPGGVCLAQAGHPDRGKLLPHRFTLTAGRARAAVCFLLRFPGLSAGGRYPPPCPVEPGLSSRQVPHDGRYGGPQPCRAAIRPAPNQLRNRQMMKHQRHAPPTIRHSSPIIHHSLFYPGASPPSRVCFGCAAADTPANSFLLRKARLATGHSDAAKNLGRTPLLARFFAALRMTGELRSE